MIYLGLGANCENRREYLAQAIKQLRRNGFLIEQISPVVESPALLMADAKPSWNRPYLNLVVGGETTLKPLECLALAKKTEQNLGRDLAAPKWSPRNIDIDILLWHDEQISLPELKVPHPEMYKRAFVITPLMHLAPHLTISGINLSALEISQQIRPIPLWMGIINVTPDSFSDGGKQDDLSALAQKLEAWIEAGVHIIDIGAESTRPKAKKISQKTEWARLKPVFALLSELREKHFFMPLISVDTYHASIAEKSLAAGADWINDVTALAEPKMLRLLTSANYPSLNAVAMHSMSVPADGAILLDNDKTATAQLLHWLQEKASAWQNAGLDLSRVIFDPGIGFGKSSVQNIEIIKASAQLRSAGFRLLVGHSRKSFMNHFSLSEFAARDTETLGLSLAMCEQGVDILRVHDPLQHIQAYRAWSHACA